MFEKISQICCNIKLRYTPLPLISNILDTLTSFYQRYLIFLFKQPVNTTPIERVNNLRRLSVD